MKAQRAVFFAVVSLCAVGLLPTGVAAQAPAGPLPGGPPSSSPAGNMQDTTPRVQAKTSIFGGWKLNRDDSDDPRKKMQEARGANRGNGRRMGGGPYGGHRGGQSGGSDEDRQRMQEFLTPARSLTVAEAKKDIEVDIFDDQQRKCAFFTDGRKLQKTKGVDSQEIAAHWDGARLVSDEKNPRGGKMSRAYELSYDGTQLYETLRLAGGRSNAEVSIRYVYDQAVSPAASSR